ncbi:hypothetical protein [Puniceicoccus vermicola]|uniref:CBM-cenC domain-containing protein n=1 Tax=Puniceicoccus vermicola TaxID=388746 RepID=A0A7X1B2N1_9BACT|nr:hypothetical protein [Puniceicoccus vermicola]MBC2603448.1 hypothetical protein [Puniceicoccus vermicola]
MTRYLLFLFLFSSALQAENLIDNGDFESGRKDWKGDRDIEYETDAETNKVLYFEVDDKPQEIEQEFDAEDYRVFTVTYRVRATDDYQGLGYQIRFVRDSGSSTFYDRSVKAGADWKKEKITYKAVKDSDDLKLRITVIDDDDGEGAILFDDVVLTAK